MSDQKIITLITGANQGLGFETAKNLVLHSEAYHVLLGSRDLAKGEAAAAALSADPGARGTASALQLDVTDDASVDAAAAAVAAAHGRLDVLVNNAGVFRRGEPRRVARETLATNVVGYVSVTEAFLPLLRRAAAGAGANAPARLVLVTSSLGSLAHAADPAGPYHAAVADEYRAASAARGMLVVQYWARLRTEEEAGAGGAGFRVHGADPGLCATNLADTPDQLRRRGAVEPSVGGERIACVVRGDRDADVGRVCGEYGVAPW